jgi:hypothetical protein
LISKLIGNLYFILLNPMLHLELETTDLFTFGYRSDRW